jgi:L-rhamnose mutarotase
MKRYGKIYYIRPESMNEYKKDHDEIWPEMKQLINDAGFRNYTIFAKDDGQLFAYWEHEDLEKGKKILQASPISLKWETMMDKYFIKKDKSIIGPEYTDLNEVWHQD